MRLPEEPFRALGLELFGVAAPLPREVWLPCRAAQSLPDPAAVIVCAFPYYTGPFERQNIARYAALPDYHKVVGEMLAKLCESLADCVPGRYRAFVDSSPFPEKRLAAQAGLGVLGDNTLLLTERYGSYVFLGCIATDVPYTPTGDGQIHSCDHCGACKAACPGCALQDGFDRTRCVSAVTQKKGTLTPEETELLRKAGSVWGCDLCQTVCLWNREPAVSPLSALFSPAEPVVTTENLPALHKTRAFGWRPVEVLLRNLDAVQSK